MLRCAALALALSACGAERQIAIQIDPQGRGLEIAAYELAVIDGAECPTAASIAEAGMPDDAIARQSFYPSEAMSLGDISPGDYRMIVLARDVGCLPILYGCQAFVVGEDESVRVMLATIEGDVPRCPEGSVCMGSVCRDDLPSDCSACQPADLVACVDGACEVRTSEPGDVDDADEEEGTYGPMLQIASTREDGVPWVHFGVAPVITGGFAAEILSIRLSELDEPRPNVVSVNVSDLTELDTVNDIAFCPLPNGDLSYGLAGNNPLTPRQAQQFGALREPGMAEHLISIELFAEPVQGVGPHLCIGGAGGHPLIHVTRTRRNASGDLSLHAIFVNATPLDTLDDTGPFPSGDRIGSSASRGAFLVMEYEIGGNILLWNPVENDFGQIEERAEPETPGPPVLVYEGGASYVLAYSVGDSIVIRRLRCTNTCNYDDVPGTMLVVGAPIEHYDMVPYAGGLVVVVSAQRATTVVEAYPLDPTLARVPNPTTPIELASLAADRRTFGMRATIVVEEHIAHLVTGVLVGPAATSADALRVLHTVFEP